MEDLFSYSFILFIKNLRGQNIIIGDNLFGHLSIEVKLGEVHNVRFILSPPNVVHLCQPCLAFFRALKAARRKVLGEWKKKKRCSTEMLNKMFQLLLNHLNLLSKQNLRPLE